MAIYANLTFPGLRCGVIQVDVMDVAGEQQISSDRKMFKQRLAGDGSLIGAPYHDTHKVEAHPTILQINGIPVQIVNPMGHGHDHDHGEKDGEPEFKDPSLEGEGCVLFGTVTVNKVAGNFHIALGASHKSGGRHVHHFMLSDGAPLAPALSSRAACSPSRGRREVQHLAHHQRALVRRRTRPPHQPARRRRAHH
jgi:hypothetical protein